MGLQLIGTPSTELAQQLDQAGHLRSIAVGDVQALLQALMELQPESAEQAVTRRHWMQAQFDIEIISRPLMEWLRSPHRALTVADPSALLAVDHARLRDELSTMRATPTWRLIAAAHRALRGDRDS